jgi:hypothetical protein
MRILPVSIAYDNSWNSVTLAVFNKYPNPFAKHVLSADVIDRRVENDILYTTRLITKRGILPDWAKRLWNIKKVYVLEQSVCDPLNRIMKYC